MAKRREDYAITFCQLQKTLTGRLIEITFEFKGKRNVLDPDWRYLVDAERTPRIP
jgi:hypothetical protein